MKLVFYKRGGTVSAVYCAILHILPEAPKFTDRLSAKVSLLCAQKTAKKNLTYLSRPEKFVFTAVIFWTVTASVMKDYYV